MNNVKMLEMIMEFEKAQDFRLIEEIKAELLANIREEEAKKHGFKDEEKIISNMIKKSSVRGYDGYIEKNGKFYFLDGHRIFASDKNYNFPEAENTNIEPGKMVNSLASEIDESFKVNLPELRTFCKLHRTTKKNVPVPYVIKFDESLIIAVNPHYLLDACLYAENTIVHFKRTGAIEFLKSPLYMEGNEKQCLILPIRPQANTHPNQDSDGNVL